MRFDAGEQPLSVPAFRVLSPLPDLLARASQIFGRRLRLGLARGSAGPLTQRNIQWKVIRTDIAKSSHVHESERVLEKDLIDRPA
jgi:hypothetical protein